MIKNRRLQNAAILITIFVALAALLRAQPVKLRVTADLANLREKPDIGSAMILQVRRGAELDAEAKEGEWWKVRTEAGDGILRRGFVHESLVAVVEPPAIKPEFIEPKKTEEKPPRNPKIEPKPVPPAAKEKPVEVQRATAKESPAAPPAALSGFSLVLAGEAEGIAGGDLNDGAEGMAEFYRERFAAAGSGEVSPLRLVFSGLIEFRIPLIPGAYLGIGTGYVSGQNQSSVAFQEAGTLQLFTAKPQMRAVPVSFSLFFYPVKFFCLRAGVEYFFAESQYFYRIEKGVDWQQWQGKARGNGPGFIGGMGLEFGLGPRFAFVLESSYRTAVIKTFEGTNTTTDSTGFSSTEKGTLYAYDVNSFNKTYTLVFIRNVKPSEAGVSASREAGLDLSGFRVAAGLKISF